MIATPITEIFGGLVHTVRTAGKDELHMRQPFFSLQLDIQSDKVRSVEDALRQLTLTESIQDYTCPKTNKHIEASTQSFLEQLPPILILHAKLFSFDKSGGMKKLMKKVDFPMVLEIPRECLLQDRLRCAKRYKLLAVVYHEGTEANKGHFITDLYHIGTSMWLRCDDSVVSEISVQQLLHPTTPKTPYLLFYRRCDTLRQASRV
jgi:ubiquitin carboxyl-terminal hydrolase 10